MSKDDWVKQFESMTICLMPDFFTNYHQREVIHHMLNIRVHSEPLSQVTQILGKFCYWDSQFGMDCCWTLIFKVRISFKAKKPFVQDKNYLLKYPPSNHLYFKNGCLGYKMIDVTLPKNSTGKQPKPSKQLTQKKTRIYIIPLEASFETVNLNQVNSQSYGLFYRVIVYLSSWF